MRGSPLILALVMIPLSALLPADPKPVMPPDLPDGTERALKQIPQFRVPQGFKVDLFAAEPKLASPVAISLDEKNRVFVAEEYRIGGGAAENRSNPAFSFSFFLEDDLQITSTEDRLKVYKKWAHKFPTGFQYFSAQPDQVRLLEDTNGDGKADRSSIFAGGFNQPLDGLCAGVLALNGSVYVTNIPSLYKFQDTKKTGTADKKEILLTGFGPNIAFYGHDLHGLIVGPDGRLYFSVGDRGYHVTSKEGKLFSGPRNGAVFRCNLDGTDLEVIHRGLRNPQELAFDQFGNLFADDNNCDKGDHGRLVYVCDGGTSGWNMAYQTMLDPYLTGPWHAERLWHEPHQGQAAYIVPTVGAIGTGPSGFLFTSGTALPKRYENSFLMCNYTGNGGLESFKLKQKGAGYEIVDYHDFFKPIKATDAEFGTDGKLYISDFVDLKWNGGSAGGAIYTLYDPKKLEDPVIQQTKRLFSEGFAHRKPTELVELLYHPDQRVRQRAQFALVEQNASEELKKVAKIQNHLLARLHAIWGLGQLVRSKPDAVVAPLISLLFDQEMEVRAQAAKTLGDRGVQKSATDLIPLLADREARVRYFAAEALGKLKHKPAVKPLMQVLRENADQDPFLRHAAVTALIRIEDKPSVLGFARDTSTAVRLGVVLCLRGWQDGAIADFLSDADLFVRVEAARAIHDLPLEPVFPKLADQLRTLYADGPLAEADALARRALNAAFRLGTPAWAEQIGALALRTNTPAHIRAEALACLRDWAKPSPRDRVNGFWRPLPERDTATARAVVSKIYPELLRTTVGTLQRDVIQLMTDLKISVDRAALEKQARDSNQDPELRAALLRLLATGEGKLSSETMTVALKDTAPVVRSTARDLLAKIDPQAAVAELSHAFTAPESTVHDQQQALQTLQRLNTPEAGKLLDSIADKLANGTLPASITLDAWEAIKAVPTASRDALRRKFEAKMPADPVGRFQVSLEGGDRQRGKEIFFNHTAAQCVRCHKAEKTGGIAGPDLSEIARRVPEKTRQYLLESLLVPSAKIAQGYANVTLTLTDGRILAGTILSETAAQVILQTPDGKKLTVPQEDIETRTVPTSPMPSVEKTLTAREIRDLVEYLSTLR